MRTVPNIGEERDIIYVYEIYMDNSTIFASTESITLSGRFYDGGVVSRESLVSLNKSVDISNGGTLGDKSNTTLDLIRFSGNALIDQFFNDFFPATSKPYITSRDVHIGITWVGASSISDITYLKEFYVNDYSYDTKHITLDLIEKTDLERKTLPFYKARTEGSDPIESYPLLPPENENRPIPITYGSYREITEVGSATEDARRIYLGGGNTINGIPALVVGDDSLTVIPASHKCSATSSDAILSKYIQGLNTQLRITSRGTPVFTNNVLSSTFKYIPSAGLKVVGELIIPLKRVGDASTLIDEDISNIVNLDTDDYNSLESDDRVSLTASGSASTSEVGVITDPLDISTYFRLSTDGSGNKTAYIGNREADETDATETETAHLVTSSSPVLFFFSGGIDPAVEDVLSTQFFVRHEDSGFLRTYLGFVLIENTIITDVKSYSGTLKRQGLRLSGGKALYKPKEDFLSGQVYAHIDGRQYGTWIEQNGRTNGRSIDTTILPITYMIESLIRDEILTERKRFVTSIISSSSFTCDELNEQVITDYYANSYLLNTATNTEDRVTGSSGNVLFHNGSGYSANDQIAITNVKDPIDESSFDSLGATTTGTRSAWRGRRSVADFEESDILLNDALRDSWSILVKAFDQYRIIDLDSGSTVGTFTNPLKAHTEQVSVELTGLDEIYTSFELKYNFSHMTQDYLNRAYIDPNTDTIIVGSTYQAKCANAEKNHKRTSLFSHSSGWIYEESTARLFLQKAVDWFTERRLIVKWRGSVKNHIQYEIGDKVKIDYPDMIPAGINNSATFMITGIEHDTSKKMRGINFTLVQLP